jgi:hypothetical protein
MATLQQLQTQRAEVYAAYQAALKSQEFTVGAGNGARRSRRADFDTIAAELARLDAAIARLTPTRRVFNPRPR